MLSQKLHITLPLLRSWAPRTLLLVCIGALSPSWVGIQAQDTLRTCRAQVTMITPEHSIKEVIAVVMRSYDVPDIALEQNDKVIRFTTTSNVQLDELSELTEGSGARVLFHPLWLDDVVLAGVGSGFGGQLVALRRIDDAGQWGDPI